MTAESTSHSKIAAEKTATPSEGEARRLVDAYKDDKRTQTDNQHRAAVQEHNLKVAKQFYLFRFFVGFIASTFPWLTLFYVLWRMSCGAFEHIHPAGQAILVSGSFLTVVILYGFLLRGIFLLMRDKQQRDTSRNLHEDIPESSTDKWEGEGYVYAIREQTRALKGILDSLRNR